MVTRQQRYREKLKKNGECAWCHSELDRKGVICTSCLDKSRSKYGKRSKAPQKIVVYCAVCNAEIPQERLLKHKSTCDDDCEEILDNMNKFYAAHPDVINYFNPEDDDM